MSDQNAPSPSRCGGFLGVRNSSIIIIALVTSVIAPVATAIAGEQATWSYSEPSGDVVDCSCTIIGGGCDPKTVECYKERIGGGVIRVEPKMQHDHQ